MALRKFYIVLECEDESQYNNVQNIFNELSNARAITANTMLRAYPMYKAREMDIRQLFSLMRENGIKGLLSMQGAGLLAKLARK